MQTGQVGSDSGLRMRMGFKPLKLRMGGISSRLPQQHGLS